MQFVSWEFQQGAEDCLAIQTSRSPRKAAPGSKTSVTASTRPKRSFNNLRRQASADAGGFLGKVKGWGFGEPKTSEGD